MYLLFHFTKKIINRRLNLALFSIIIIITAAALVTNNIDNPLLVAIQHENEAITQMLDDSNLADESKIALTQQYEDNKQFLEAYNKEDYALAFKVRKERMEFIKKLEENRNNTEEVAYLDRLILEFDYLSRHRLYFNALGSGTKGFNFVTHTVINGIIPILFISYIVLLASDLYTSKYVDDVDIEKTYPITLHKATRAKLLSLFIVVGVLFIFHIGISFAISSLFFGIGSPIYPYIGYTSNLQALSVYTLQELLMKAIGMLILLCLCAITLVSLLSNIIKNKLHLFFVSTMLILGQSFVIPEIPVLAPIASIFPFVYLKPIDVISLNLAHQMGNASMNFYVGSIVIIFWSIVFYFMSVINKKS